LAQMLRLDREYDDVSRAHRVLGLVEAGDAVLVDHLAAGIGADLAEAYALQGKILAQHPADERVGHVAAANERDPHDFLSLSPKIAVPTRTIVAPSAIAASMSADMPIESVSSPRTRRFSSSRSSRS